jgi:hypothetical protein
MPTFDEVMDTCYPNVGAHVARFFWKIVVDAPPEKPFNKNQWDTEFYPCPTYAQFNRWLDGTDALEEQEAA